MNLKYSWLMVFRKLKFVAVFLFMLVGVKSVLAQLSPDLVIIGNEIGSNMLSKKQTLLYAKGETSFWTNGKKVVIALPSQKSELASTVATNIYKTTVNGMQKYWLSLVFQGRVDPPFFFASDEEIIRFVQNNKGAIGFIHAKNKSKAADLVIEVKD